MACFAPLQAWRSHVLQTDKGKNIIAFKREQVSHLPYESITLPCGKCLGCLFDRSKQWAVRCVHEAQTTESDGKPSCFITLTFNEESLNGHRHDCRKCDYYKQNIANEEKQALENPDYIKQIVTTCHTRSLCRRDFTLFIKSLREHVNRDKKYQTRQKIRYFHVGEYGSKLGRPHHHALLFGWAPEDLVFHSYDRKTGVTLYTSEYVSKIWKYGFITVGEVNWKTAAYCARYCIKKINGKDKEKHYERFDPINGEIGRLEAEYITTSRRPGLGRDWILRNLSDVYPADGLHIQGRAFKTPRFYDKLYEEVAPEEYETLKRKRLTAAKENAKADNYQRRKSKRIIAEKNNKRLCRSLEDEG